MSRHTNEDLGLALDYTQVMEQCAAYLRCNTDPIREPPDAYKLVLPVLQAATQNAQEAFGVILLNTKNRAICPPVICTMGLLDSSPVHPREIFRAAVRESAASVILVHNHPSGDPTPSKEDIEITRRLVEAARILGIRIVDHVICGRPTEVSPGYISLREKNLVAFG